MTATAHGGLPTLRETVPSHPLDRLTGAEIEQNRLVLSSADLVGASTRFALVSLDEPAKVDVLAYDGGPVERRVKSLLLDRCTGAVTETVVSLLDAAVVSTRSVDVITEGQPPIMAEEFVLVEEVLRRDPGWCAAMHKRGVDDVGKVRVSALSAGVFDIPGEQGRRLVRCLSFLQLHEQDNPWAHPIDGVVGYVDLITREVVDLIDDAVFDLPTRSYDFHLDAADRPVRTSLRPIEITQPEGPSFTVDGNVVEWENRRFRVGFDPVEGLVLHQIGFRDAGRLRPVVYRASIAEMVVPYGLRSA